MWTLKILNYEKREKQLDAEKNQKTTWYNLLTLKIC